MTKKLSEDEKQQRILMRANAAIDKAEKRKKRKKIENMTEEQIEKQRGRDRQRDAERKVIKNMTPEQIEKQRERDRKRDRVENMKPEQIENERKRKRNRDDARYQKRCKQNLGVVSDFDESKVPIFDPGNFSVECQYCGALSLPNESAITSHYCCHLGKVKLPPLSDFPESFESLLKNKKFIENIRSYNNAFAFISFNAKDVSKTMGVGPN
jgi:hypothetical protein